jgi:ABC-type sugar transport system ATPase subunit
VVAGRVEAIRVTPGMSASIFTTHLGAAMTRVSGQSRRRERDAVAAGPALVMEEVCKSYAAGAWGCRAVVRVLEGVSLRLGAGEIVGLAGGEGAGKSTLLLCAAGVVLAERGRIRWGAGEDEYRDGAVCRPLYLDLSGKDASRDVRNAVASGARVILLDHAPTALLSELRGMLARSRPGSANASAIVVTSRSRAELARVVARVLVLREGRLAGDESLTRTGLRASATPPSQRKRSAARASSESPASFAWARMRST